MGWFTKKRTIEERFPMSRLQALPMALGGTLAGHVLPRGGNLDQAFKSKFFGGYLLGFPHFLDEIDENIGTAVRKVIFEAILGPVDGPALCAAAMGGQRSKDGQTIRGFMSGIADGNRYFEALDKGKEATSATHSLEYAVTHGLADLNVSAI